jgi:hypothetical protein
MRAVEHMLRTEMLGYDDAVVDEPNRGLADFDSGAFKGCLPQPKRKPTNTIGAGRAGDPITSTTGDVATWEAS